MRTSIVSTALAAAAVLTAGSSLRASVVYQETFGIYNGQGTGGPGSGQASFFNYDWDAQTASASIAANTATTNGAISLGGNNGGHVGGTGPNAGSSTIIGTPSQSASAGPINYTAAFAGSRSAANDAIAIKAGLAYNATGDATVLDYTKEYNIYSGGDALNTVNHPGLTFSWFEGNTDNNGGYSLAVEVGGQWYVTVQVFNNEAGTNNGVTGTTQLATNAFENNVAYVSSGWDLLNFNGDYSFTAGTEGAGNGNPGTASTDSLSTVGLSRGSAVTSLDTTANIQAFGLFSDTTGQTGNRRFDSFTITDSTPEPASLALVGIGSLVMLRRRRSI